LHSDHRLHDFDQRFTYATHGGVRLCVVLGDQRCSAVLTSEVCQYFGGRRGIPTLIGDSMLLKPFTPAAGYLPYGASMFCLMRRRLIGPSTYSAGTMEGPLPSFIMGGSVTNLFSPFGLLMFMVRDLNSDYNDL